MKVEPVDLSDVNDRLDYKFVRIGEEEKARWEQGPNRVLQAPPLQGPRLLVASFDAGAACVRELTAEEERARLAEARRRRPCPAGQQEAERWQALCERAAQELAGAREEARELSERWRDEVEAAARAEAELRLALLAAQDALGAARRARAPPPLMPREPAARAVCAQG
ncbi:unnamed protein product, partial [Prorocentrum cordatum]